MRWLAPRVAATSVIGAMAAVVMEAGCGPNPGIQCRKSSDCTGGAYCNLELNVCFVRSDAICVTDAGVDAGTSPAVFNVTVSPSATACSGGRVTIGLDGSALGVTYQVMRESTPYGSPRAGTGAPLALAAATEPGVYTVVATATDTGCSSHMDGNASITFSSLSAGTAAASLPEICAFSSTSLALTGQTGANHWQWQVSAHGAEAWGDVPGATSATLSTGALAASMDYRAVVTSGACPLASSTVATVTVDPASAAGTASATPAGACPGSSSSLSLSSVTGAINWQSSSDNMTWNDIAGATSNPFVTAGATGATYYRARVISGVCASTYSNSTEVTLNTLSTAPAGATAIPTGILNGASSTLFVTGGALGTGAHWQWYQGSCGGSPVSQGANIRITPTSTTTYYVRAEGTCNTTTCQSVTVSVCTPSCAGRSCGGDGCGGSCGGCTPPQTCEGSGIPGQCGSYDPGPP